MCCLEEVYCNCDMFSVVNVNLDHWKFCLCVLIVEGMSVVINVMLPIMSVMNPPPGLCNLSVRTVVKICILGFRSELDFLNCDDICVCVVNKQFELLEFVFDSVYVDLQYDEISLTFIAVSVCLCGVSSPVVVLGLSVRLLWYCDACTVVCVACVYDERM